MRTCPTCQRTYPEEMEFCPGDGSYLTQSERPTDWDLVAGLARRYRVIRELGAGGMGTVFLAEQIAVGNRPVALKVLLRKLLDDPEFLLRFHNEAASTGRIRHPNVVTIYESGQGDDGTPYIAMEYLEGETLRQRLQTRGALPVAECSEILQQVARGLHAGHKLGIIHRDLKPDNIFLTRGDEGELLVKVVDFGIAKLRDTSTNTLTGVVLGTPAYMSAEQASGISGDELDARSDVYSLGIVVYEMLSGRVPFYSDTPLGYIRKHMLEEPQPLRSMGAGLDASREVEEVVMKALLKDRDLRYQTTVEFARDFAEAARDAEQPSYLADFDLTTDRAPGPPAFETEERDSPTAPPADQTEYALDTPTPMTAGELRETTSEKESDSASFPTAEKGMALDTPAPAANGDSADAGFGPGESTPGETTPGMGLWGPAEEKRPSARTPAPPIRPEFPQPATSLPPAHTATPTRRPTVPTPPPIKRRKASPLIWIAAAIAAGLALIAVIVLPLRRPKVDTIGMVFIHGGTFMMGRDRATDRAEGPAHLVTVNPYFLDKAPVTNADYAEFVRAAGHAPPSTWNQGTYAAEQSLWPVTGVTWDDAQAYAAWKGKRLPTEAEWEFAVRGIDGRLYPWGDVFNPKLTNSLESGIGHGQPVGSHPDAVSPFGAYDMSGNVWQWCQDAYQPYPGGRREFEIPVTAKVLRGGSFKSDRFHVTATTRNLDLATAASDVIGFRCAKSP